MPDRGWSTHPGTCKFFPVILTNHGGWYYRSNDFMVEVTHSGDEADSFNIEAERFDHTLARGQAGSTVRF